VTVLCLISSNELDVCSWLVSAVSKLALLVGLVGVYLEAWGFCPFCGGINKTKC